jgi:hypothetical protein
VALLETKESIWSMNCAVCLGPIPTPEIVWCGCDTSLHEQCVAEHKMDCYENAEEGDFADDGGE